ncbi:hypothetical protein B7486_65900 [cyanobacterium TDX16]|nr:hypothetical protein B7486_65900 [cyanobacterium TDX16]
MKIDLHQVKVKSYRVALAKLSRRIVILVAVGIFFASIEVFAGIPRGCLRSINHYANRLSMMRTIAV